MIFLASTSPRRRRILKDLGIRFRAVTPRYHEKNPPGLSPSEIVKTHALAKARSAAPLVKNGVLLAADTLVYFKRGVVGKPGGMKDAFRILGALQGRRHVVYTGVAIASIRNGKIVRKKVYFRKTGVYLRSMEKKEMASYLRKIKPLDKAGAYAIQSSRAGIVRKVQGSFSSAVGLPAEGLKSILRRFCDG